MSKSYSRIGCPAVLMIKKAGSGQKIKIVTSVTSVIYTASKVQIGLDLPDFIDISEPNSPIEERLLGNTLQVFYSRDDETYFVGDSLVIDSEEKSVLMTDPCEVCIFVDTGRGPRPYFLPDLFSTWG